MASPSLAVARPDRRVSAFNRLVSVLKKDPTLNRIVGERWLVPGSKGYDDPIPAGATAVRLTPRMAPPEPFATAGFGRVTYLAPVSVLVETRVKSNAWEDSANLWAAIEAAALGRGKQPGDLLAFRAALQADGIDDLDPVRPADTPEDDAVARGELLITCYLET